MRNLASMQNDKSGLRLILTSEEVKKQAEARAKYHSAKQAWYESKESDVKALNGQLEDAESAPGGYMSGSAAGLFHKAEALKTSAERHRERALYFAALAKFVAPKTRFNCTPDVLLDLEFNSVG